MKKNHFIVLSASIVGILFVGIIVNLPRFSAAPAASVSSPFTYSFSSPGRLEETSSMDLTSSPYWWLNSGAYLYIADGVGKTIQGDLPAYDKWRLRYALSNSTDTDNGYHPQNIFRLVTRSKWRDFSEQAYFRITKTNTSQSQNRTGSNGLLLFNRYQDGNNLYYAGIRVDGAAVIKKKQNGAYYTLASKKIFPGTYDRSNNPNLLPKDIWIGLRSESRNNADGSVTLKLFMDNGKTGNWTLLVEAQDSGSKYGSSPITKEGYAGIRTDFMDVFFDDYKATSF